MASGFYAANPQSQPQQQIPVSLPLHETFYNVGQVWTSEMLQKYGESQARSQLSTNHFQMAISMSNPWRSKQLKDHSHFENLSKKAKHVEDTLTKQQQDLTKFNEIIKMSGAKIRELEGKIEASIKNLRVVNGQQ
mmetsp:Transcript_6667/g.11219  ORF Transcript_6667/g.11219 Transcript_6667/m.11219 type:complete len:135 (-) Transcript_6667:282-686(-)